MGATADSIAYLPRVVDVLLAERLRIMPMAVIDGPRACGKTTTASRLAQRILPLDRDSAAREHAAHGTLPLTDGPFPTLLDEWQLAEPLWNQLRRISDRLSRPGLFLLTGSAQPTDDITRHSGAGRVARLRMRTLSLFESGDSPGTVSLAGLFDGGACAAWPSDSPATMGQTYDGDAAAQLRSVVDVLCRGGWPACVAMSPSDAQLYLTDYLEEICRVDIRQLAGRRHDPTNLRRTIASLARHSGSAPTMKTLAADIAGRQPLAHATLQSYLSTLEAIHISEDQPHWSPHLASRARLRQAAKRHLADPALAVNALSANAQRLLDDRALLGHLFESLAVRDLRIYAHALGGSVYHYSDSNGLEADAIVELRDDRWIAVEVKLGEPSSIDEGAASLNKLCDHIDTDRMGPPAKLLVITATGYAYERSDGVAVTPLTLLGP
ncbi:MAG: DUF4143 domain-containing protein [Acidimicrobiaceae bacterium]|nr:DUF4143 domain-containing protein [Acidimicrobiaceae bacterium]